MSLTQKQMRVLACVKNYAAVHGSPPSHADLARVLQVHPQTLRPRMRSLRRLGLLVWDSKVHRSTTITDAGLAALERWRRDTMELVAEAA
jgi:Mn-dependent DtxR family transcriptional regulator